MRIAWLAPALLLAVIDLPPQAPALAIEPCSRPAISGRTECGALRVPENRQDPRGRTISIFFVVARATMAGQSTDEPIFFFTGGPGSAASTSAGALSQELAGLRGTRDFVFIDQRGTGRSAPLSCPFSENLRTRLAPMFDAAATAACRQTLSAGADLRFYTTTEAVHDVEAVRKALGYQQINLHGSSYGTRPAWQYAARFPAHTRSMVLHGPAGPGFHLPIPFARGLDVALEGVVAACLEDAACAGRFRSLRRDVARAFDRLRAKPVRVTIAPPANEAARGLAPVEGDFTHGELAEAIRYQLYTTGGARRVPLLLTRAAAGDYAPVAQASIENRLRLERQLHRGMFMSVTCAEDVPFMSEEVVRSSSAGTRLGDYRVRQQIAACGAWTKPVPPGPGGPLLSTPVKVPALLQVGEFDPATPLEWARRAMPLLPNGRLVIVPNGAHAFGGLGLGGCIPGLTMAFITRGSAKGLDTSCVAAARRPPFELE